MSVVSNAVASIHREVSVSSDVKRNTGDLGLGSIWEEEKREKGRREKE